MPFTGFGARTYQFLIHLVAPLALIRLWLRGFRDPDYRQRWRERFGFIATQATGKNCIWVHAVSVGEMQAARPLIDALLEQCGTQQDLVVSTTTPSGHRIFRQHYGDRIRHYYFPLDLPGVVNRYLDRLQPRLLVLIETELWPNLIAACAERDIRLALVNARLSERSYRGYQRFAPLVQSTLRRCTFIAAQTRADQERLVLLGAPAERTIVSGSIKFDVIIPASVGEQGEALRASIGTNRPVLIAASTHAGEEEAVLRVFQKLRASIDDLFLILVPRHPDRAPEIIDQLRRENLSWQSRSSGNLNFDAIDVYLGDTMGELPVLYASADVAFVGGSLVDIGGHNLLEPAALGLPVVTGSVLFNFQEIADLLRDNNALRVVEDETQLAEVLMELFGDANLRASLGEAANTFVTRNRGATTLVREQLLAFAQASESARIPPENADD